MRPLDLLNLVVLGAMWGASFPLLRYAAPQFGPFALIAVRLAVASIVVFSIWRVLAEVRAHWRRLAVMGLINTAVPFTLFAFAALLIPSGVNSLLNATTPIFGALIARFWLDERLSGQRWAGILLAFAGVGAIVYETAGFSGAHPLGAGRSALGIASGLSAACLYGLAVCYARRYLVGLPAPVLTAGSVGMATLMLTPVSLLALPAKMPTIGGWAAAAMLGLMCTAAAYLLYFRLLKAVGAARAVTVTFLIPVFGLLWGAIFFGEKVGLRLLSFCGVVLLGTALATGLFERGAGRAQVRS